MQWTRSETIALAKESCVFCRGFGMRRGRKMGTEYPCPCVFRTIFRACYARFCECVTQERRLSRVSLDICPGAANSRSYGRKDEEYIADFCLVSRRALDTYEYKIFRYHYLLSADWRLCCPRLAIDRGEFFHMLYRIEEKLGRAYGEIRPYALWPLDEYFSQNFRRNRAAPAPVIPICGASNMLCPPFLKTA